MIGQGREPLCSRGSTLIGAPHRAGTLLEYVVAAPGRLGRRLSHPARTLVRGSLNRIALRLLFPFLTVEKMYQSRVSDVKGFERYLTVSVPTMPFSACPATMQ